MKMGRLHRVPLSKQALAIVRDLQAISRGGRWLFPSVRSISRPISENTSNAALRWLGYSKGEWVAAIPTPSSVNWHTRNRTMFGA
jgi:integrase